MLPAVVFFCLFMSFCYVLACGAHPECRRAFFCYAFGVHGPEKPSLIGGSTCSGDSIFDGRLILRHRHSDLLYVPRAWGRCRGAFPPKSVESYILTLVIANLLY
jgi:hypothetical protein